MDKLVIRRYGREIPAYLYPAGKRAVIIGHGLLSSKDSRTAQSLRMILPQHGITTLRIDLYGHGERKENLSNVTIHHMVDDFLIAYEFLIEHGFSPIGLLGSSFSGLPAVIAATKASISALALKAPMLYLPERFKPKEGEFVLHKGVKFSSALASTFPNADEYAKKLRCFTLIVHGDKDSVIPIEHSKRFASLSGHIRLLTIHNADHNFSNPKHFNTMVEEISNFFIRHL